MFKGEFRLERVTPVYQKLALLFTVLTAIGLLMVFDTTFHLRANNYYYFLRTLAYLAIGMLACLVGLRAAPERLRRAGFPLVCLSFFCLLLLWTPLGREINGARRWLNLGISVFQPSELVKLSFLIYLCDFLARKQGEAARGWSMIWPPLLLLGPGLGLILVSPDLGTVVLFAAAALVVCLVAGIPVGYFLGSLGLALAAMAGLIIQKPYRLERVTALIRSWNDPFDFEGAYHLGHALTAIGRGGLRGVGLGNARMKLFFLPEVHTDSIFAHFAETFGLLGTVFLLGVIFAVVFLGLRVVERSPDRFSSLLMLGLVSMFGFQNLIHIGGNIGLIPIKGLTLPFISYGGSSLIFTLFVAGLMVNLARRLGPEEPRLRMARSPGPVRRFAR